MACISLTALPISCFAGIDAGIQKVYAIAFKDLKAINTGTTEVYSAATNGVVNTVGLVSGKTFVEIGLAKDASGVTEKLTKDIAKGVSFYTQSFTLRLNDLTIENATFIQAVTNQPVAVIYKTRQGKYFIIGLNGLLEVTQSEGGTGTASADGSGFTLTFEGSSPTVAPFIDPTIIASLVA